jgi:hypothetical protein
MDLDSVFTFGDDGGDDIAITKDLADGGDIVIAGDEPSLLAQLKNALAKDVRRTDILVEVPERKNMIIRYSPNITQHQIRAWRRGSGDSRKEGMDAVRFACHVLANTCTGILINGQEVTENGEPVTFSHEIVMQMVGATRVFDCVRAVYGLDPHVEAAALAVLDAAGFNDDVEQVDPTKVS